MFVTRPSWQAGMTRSLILVEGVRAGAPYKYPWLVLGVWGERCLQNERAEKTWSCSSEGETSIINVVGKLHVYIAPPNTIADIHFLQGCGRLPACK